MQEIINQLGADYPKINANIRANDYLYRFSVSKSFANLFFMLFLLAYIFMFISYSDNPDLKIDSGALSKLFWGNLFLIFNYRLYRISFYRNIKEWYVDIFIVLKIYWIVIYCASITFSYQGFVLSFSAILMGYTLFLRLILVLIRSFLQGPLTIDLVQRNIIYIGMMATNLKNGRVYKTNEQMRTELREICRNAMIDLENPEQNNIIKIKYTIVKNENETQMEICPICLEEKTETEDPPVAKLNNCEHMFHEHCILKWGQRHETCPVCRENMT